jgi:hypothetical protein
MSAYEINFEFRNRRFTDAEQGLRAFAEAISVDWGGSTMLNTAVNTWLTNNRNNVATLAAKLNQMIGTNAVTRPLHVVAG